MILGIAIAALVALAALKVATGASRRWLPLVAACGLAAVMVGHHFLVNPLGYGVDAESTGLALHASSDLRAALEDSATDLVIVVNGASVTARGVDGRMLEARLRHRTGLSIAVVQVSLAGANHIERQAIARTLVRGLSRSQRARLADLPLVVLWEVHRGYDTELLAQFEENQGSARAFAYLDLEGATEWLQASGMSDRPAIRRKARALVPEVAWHTGISTLRIGSAHWLVPIDSVRPLAGFNPEERLREEARVVGLASQIERMREVRSPGAPRYVDRVLIPTYLGVFANPRTEVVLFAPPSRHVGHMAYVQQVCKDHADLVCIGFRNRALLERLDHRRFWVDAGHLAPEGAAIYTRWLSDVLAEAIIRHDMARQRDGFG